MTKISGVVNTKVGYSGGNKETANYQALCSGNTRHAEVVEVNFLIKIRYIIIKSLGYFNVA